MTAGAPRASGADLLTRTILQLDGVISAASIAEVTHALQRVPGVLLAEVNSAGNRATVAHDDAVRTAALLEAAGCAGVDAKIIPNPSAAAASAGDAVRPPAAWNRYAPLFAAAVFATFVIADMPLPNAAGKHWVLLALLSVLWLGIIAKSIVRRRRT